MKKEWRRLRLGLRGRCNVEDETDSEDQVKKVEEQGVCGCGWCRVWKLVWRTRGIVARHSCEP